MTGTAQLRSYFSSDVRERGERYFRDNHVSLDRDDGMGVEAWVVGTENDYFVQFEWDGGRQWSEVYCDCPHFQDGHYCKHLWATLLEVESARNAGRLPDQLHDDGYALTASAQNAWHPGDPSVVTPNRHSASPWRDELERLEYASQSRLQEQSEDWSRRLVALPREIWYVLDVTESNLQSRTQLQFLQREPQSSGELGPVTPLAVTHEMLDRLPEGEDRRLLAELRYWYDREMNPYGWPFGRGVQPLSECAIPGVALQQLLPRLCATQRYVWRLGTDESPVDCRVLQWDDGPAWQFRVDVTEVTASDVTDAAADWLVRGMLFRGEAASWEECPLTEPLCVDVLGAVYFEDRVARLDVGQSGPWLTMLRRAGSLQIPSAEREGFLEQLSRTIGETPLTLPDDQRLPVQDAVCQARLRIVSEQELQAAGLWLRNDMMYAKIDFLYAPAEERDLDVSGNDLSGEVVCFEVDAEEQGCVHPATGTYIRRSSEAESKFLATLLPAQVSPVPMHVENQTDLHVEFLKNGFVDVVRQLTEAGWVVEAEGRRVRRPGGCSVSVRTQMDWFELDGHFEFGEATATLPALLAAMHSGERFVRLDDGSHGLLPEEWLHKYGRIASLGEHGEEAIRFRPAQAMLLDTLLDAHSEVHSDQRFRGFVERLRNFDGIRPRKAPRTFQGTLRPYQEEGLSWLHFLRDFRLGGCLADDMGLGKTVQVLALLESRRIHRLKDGEERRPSLVVVPNSLVFNWIEEAERFTPKLRVMNYTGSGRKSLRDQFDDFHVIVTTYGTLRRDIDALLDFQFDYAILDEAQAIKNANSVSAKACRLIPARYRLAMTGTPVENHLGELWSLFEFLNPGMLGRSTAFKNLTGSSRTPDESSLQMLAASLKPYLLRRTKEQVLADLPEKTEQTLFCEMPRRQRKYYDELRDYYRTSLKDRIEGTGLNKAKMHVLEALLRLRQAACHPGLIHDEFLKSPSAKLELLLEQLDELATEGHKVLVFSQFTSLLAIVRKELEARGVEYEYLDGQTRQRKACVDRFQTEPSCQVFLISLKAGGHGLNLTAAEYVFILDPWWNPAVEAQAVDRAHRIGQTRHVFAYRLICRDTVEERILELQREKRELADAIVSADQSLISSLTAEDLQRLLS